MSARECEYVVEHLRHVHVVGEGGMPNPGFDAWVPIDKVKCKWEHDAMDIIMAREGARSGRYRVLLATRSGLVGSEFTVTAKKDWSIERVRGPEPEDDPGVVVGLTEAA